MTITTNNQNASAYQWVDCDDNNSPIANETNSSFTATQDGNYAVEITENGCVSTSACVSIATASISQNNAINMLIYPNPTKNSFILETANSNVVDQLIITNIAGQIVLNLALNSEQTKVNMAQLDAGTYLCTLLKNGKNMAVKRVVKED